MGRWPLFLGVQAVTLLESIVALTIVSLSAIGYLGVYQESMRGAHASAEWLVAAAHAGSRLDDAVTAVEQGRAPLPADSLSRVDVRPWRGRLADVAVTVRLADGREMTVHRLARIR